jgi:hypothetical protein
VFALDTNAFIYLLNAHFSQARGERGVGTRACRLETHLDAFFSLEQRVGMSANTARTSAYATDASEAITQA